MILFVASNPSHLNYDPNVPFKGSRSERNFNEWVEQLAPDGDYQVVNAVNIVTLNNRPLTKGEVIAANQTLCEEIVCRNPNKIIALGNTAEIALKIAMLTIDRFEYFKLPHPSPANRLLNNKIQLNAVLEECEEWLRQ